MQRTHLIYGEKIIIDWEKSERLQGGGGHRFLLIGQGDDGEEYEAVGIYHGEELIEIKEVQTI